MLATRAMPFGICAIVVLAVVWPATAASPLMRSKRRDSVAVSSNGSLIAIQVAGGERVSQSSLMRSKRRDSVAVLSNGSMIASKVADGESVSEIDAERRLPRTREPFNLIKRGLTCWSLDKRIGTTFRTVQECASAVETNGGKFFVYGKQSKATKGRCYIEYTTSKSCPEGFFRAYYDFYDLPDVPAARPSCMGILSQEMFRCSVTFEQQEQVRTEITQTCEKMECCSRVKDMEVACEKNMTPGCIKTEACAQEKSNDIGTLICERLETCGKEGNLAQRSQPQRVESLQQLDMSLTKQLDTSLTKKQEC